MTLKPRRIVGSFLIGAAVTVAATACGTSETVDPAVQRALDSVLVDGEFPAGYRVVAVSDDEKKTIIDQLDDSRSGARVSPASCKSDAAAPPAAETGSAVAVNGESTLSQSVARSDESGVGLAAAVAGECSTVTIELTAGPAKGTTATLTSRDVQAATIDGFDGVTFRQVSTTDGTDREAYIGRFHVDGYLVVVQAVKADGGMPDRASFDQTVSAAVAKAARR